jgi:DNA-binding IclR family transcriptional regulator
METTFAILEQLKSRETTSITDLAEQLGCSKSTIHRHLSTLVDLGYVRRVNDAYRLSLQFLDFGEHARAQRPLYSVVKPEVDELAIETGERVQVMVEENDRVIYIYQRKGDRAIQTDSHIGMQVYLHSVASGKAYLAFLPESRVEAILGNTGLPAVTDNTITDEEALYTELENIRERGYALNDEENGKGVRAVGAPIRRDDDGSVVGALSLAAPKTRLDGDRFRERIPEQIKDVATVIGVKATYH